MENRNNMKTVSIKQVVANVIRNIGVGNLDAHYYTSILEWIGEAVNLLETSFTLITTSKILEVCEHIAFLPCGYVDTLCVEYKGQRLTMGTDVTDLTSQTSDFHKNHRIGSVHSDWLSTGNTIFSENTQSIIPIYSMPYNKKEYYHIQANAIQTSFASGHIKLHYLTVPVDVEGFPLIPDEQNYKEACYWYVLAKLIGAGFKSKVFDYGFADNKWREYQLLGVNATKVWTVEMAHKAIGSQIRLVFPFLASNDMFVNYETIQPIDKL